MKKLLIVMLIALLGCITGSTAAMADTQAPNISFWTTQGVTISGSGIDIGFDAWDDVGVTKVEVYDGDTYLGEARWDYWGCDHAWVYSWTAVVGNHSITAKAYDAVGNVGTSVPVTLSVPTVVTVTSPSYGTVTGVINTFTATTRDPVTKADLYIDGVFKGSSDYPQGTTSVSVNYNWDTDQYNANGDHSVQFKCYTQDGNLLSVGENTVKVVLVTLTTPQYSNVWGTLTNFAGAFRYPVTRADLYIDGVNTASVQNINSTNYNIAYNWDTTQYVDNTYHNIEIRGYTVDGNRQISGTFTVYVDNISDEGG